MTLNRLIKYLIMNIYQKSKNSNRLPWILWIVLVGAAPLLYTCSDNTTESQEGY